MKRKRLEHLIEVIEAVPTKLFDMGEWFRTEECGTVACAAGNACMDPEFRKQGLSIGRGGFLFPKYGELDGYDAMGEFFGLSFDDTVYIFNPDLYDNIVIRKKHVIAHIREVLEGGGKVPKACPHGYS